MLLPILGGISLIGSALQGFHQYGKAEQNKSRLEEMRLDRLQQGARMQNQLKGQVDQMKSTQKVRLAANGVGLDSPMAQHLEASTEHMAAHDFDTIRLNAAQEALGLRRQADNINPWMEGLSPILGGIGMASNIWGKEWFQGDPKSKKPENNNPFSIQQNTQNPVFPNLFQDTQNYLSSIISKR